MKSAAVIAALHILGIIDVGPQFSGELFFICSPDIEIIGYHWFFIDFLIQAGNSVTVVEMAMVQMQIDLAVAYTTRSLSIFSTDANLCVFTYGIRCVQSLHCKLQYVVIFISIA